MIDHIKKCNEIQHLLDKLSDIITLSNFYTTDETWYYTQEEVKMTTEDHIYSTMKKLCKAMNIKLNTRYEMQSDSWLNKGFEEACKEQLENIKYIGKWYLLTINNENEVAELEDYMHSLYLDLMLLVNRFAKEKPIKEIPEDVKDYDVWLNDIIEASKEVFNLYARKGWTASRVYRVCDALMYDLADLMNRIEY